MKKLKDFLGKITLISGVSISTIYIINQRIYTKIEEYELKFNEEIKKLEEIHNQRISELERLHQQKIDHLNQIQESNNNWLSEFDSIKIKSFEDQYSKYLEELNLKYLNLINQFKENYDKKLEKIYNELENLYFK